MGNSGVIPRHERTYIGVTGFMSNEELETISDKFYSDGPRFMAGVLASSKTLLGHANKWPRRYPKISDIAGIFGDNANAIKLVHYSTDSTSSLQMQMMTIRRRVGSVMNGFQLNIAWPPPAALVAYRKCYPEDTIVLQVGRNALSLPIEGMITADHRVDLISAILPAYKGLVDHVLIDPSGGTGSPFDPQEVLVYLRGIKNLDLPMGLVVAGGLGPDSMDLLKPVHADFPRISIDAEGRLRDENGDLALDRAIAYVRAAHNSFYAAIA